MKKTYLNLKQKALVVAVAAAPLAASANTDIGSTIATELNKLVPIVSAVGMAMLSIYTLIYTFRVVKSLVRR